jgi:hypothetical protein
LGLEGFVETLEIEHVGFFFLLIEGVEQFGLVLNRVLVALLLAPLVPLGGIQGLLSPLFLVLPQSVAGVLQNLLDLIVVPRTLEEKVSESLGNVRVIFLLEGVFVTFEDPSVVRLSLFEVEHSVEVSEGVPLINPLLLFSRDDLLVLFRLLNILEQTVVDGLIGVLIVQTEPGPIELSLLGRGLGSVVETLDGE